MPFKSILQQFPCHHDNKCKGSGFLCAFDLTSFRFTFRKLRPGLKIAKDTELDGADMRKVMIFMECRNFMYFRSGFIGLAITTGKNNSQYLDFNTCKEDTTHFFCQVIGYVTDQQSGQIMVAVRKRRKMHSCLSDVIFCGKNMSSIFETELTYLNCDFTEIIFLNQILGPTNLPGVRMGKAISAEEESPYFSSKKFPDVWLPLEIDVLKLPSPLIRLDPNTRVPCKSRRTQSKKIYYTKLKKKNDSKNVRKWYLIEYPPLDFKQNSRIVQFAPIQSGHINRLFSRLNEYPKCEVHVETFRKILSEFMNESGKGIVSLLNIDLSQSTNTSVVVSLINHDSDIPDGCTKVHHSIHMKEFNRSVNDLNIGGGVPVFRGYPWSFKESISLNTTLVLRSTYFGSGLKRYKIDHVGSFEMIGLRQTGMASASFTCSPGLSRAHDYLRLDGSMNRTLLPIARAFINDLGEQAQYCQYHQGDVFMKSLQKATCEKVRQHICPYMIFTIDGFSNTLHEDDDFMDLEDSNLVRNALKSPKSHHGREYILEYEKIFGSAKRLPKGTTCCWTMDTNMPDESSWYIYRQFFASETCSFAFNLTSTTMETIGQVGANFYAGLFEHCSTIPIWINTKTKMVTLQKGTKSCNLAWGRSGGPRPAPQKNRNNDDDESPGHVVGDFFDCEGGSDSEI